LSSRAVSRRGEHQGPRTSIQIEPSGKKDLAGKGNVICQERSLYGGETLQKERIPVGQQPRTGEGKVRRRLSYGMDFWQGKQIRDRQPPVKGDEITKGGTG